MNKVVILVLYIFFLVSGQSMACQCTSATFKFTSYLRHSDFVGMVEIIGRDTIKDHDFDASFTLVKVIKQYHGIKQRDTIKVLESGGVDCHSCLPYHWSAKRFIIKASTGKKSDYEANLVDYINLQRDTVSENVLLLSICVENTLFIEADSVVGNITKKESLRKTSMDSGKKIVKIGNTSSHKKIGYYSVQQKMSLPKVEKIIKRRLN